MKHSFLFIALSCIASSLIAAEWPRVDEWDSLYSKQLVVALPEENPKYIAWYTEKIAEAKGEKKAELEQEFAWYKARVANTATDFEKEFAANIQWPGGVTIMKSSEVMAAPISERSNKIIFYVNYMRKRYTTSDRIPFFILRDFTDKSFDMDGERAGDYVCPIPVSFDPSKLAPTKYFRILGKVMMDQITKGLSVKKSMFSFFRYTEAEAEVNLAKLGSTSIYIPTEMMRDDVNEKKIAEVPQLKILPKDQINDLSNWSGDSKYVFFLYPVNINDRVEYNQSGGSHIIGSGVLAYSGYFGGYDNLLAYCFVCMNIETGEIVFSRFEEKNQVYPGFIARGLDGKH